ncbi:hypothetical protein QBC43DRAFT_319061 [Cladorrhinum sp. PSN259]|nr:hypothetical protein QBC43DRAFT_319061 [Cladorrhinum sp. PSN259]
MLKVRAGQFKSITAVNITYRQPPSVQPGQLKHARFQATSLTTSSSSSSSSSKNTPPQIIIIKMPRTPEAQSFFHAVYSAVQQIPPGKVTTYGHIAKLVGTPQRPRQVGVCLKHLPASPSSTTLTNDTPDQQSEEYAARFNHDTVPWQRVINAKGVISPRSQPSGARNQAAALQLEGVTVTTGALGELMVDFAEYGWFPSRLPSDLDGGDFDDDDDIEGDEET